MGLLYTAVITSIGFYISLKARNSLQATRYIMLLSVPFLMISGYTWPRTLIPGFLNAFAGLLPFTWMAEGIRTAAVKNLGIAYLFPVILALSLMSLAIVMLAAFFKKRRKPPLEIS
jgi:ABC-2 type transport system permease protein